MNQAHRSSLDELLWKRALGAARIEDPIEWAVDALADGLDGPNLRILAGLSRPGWSEVEHYFGRALDDLGIQEPTPAEARQRRIRDTAARIVLGTVSPVVGCRELCELLRNLGDTEGYWEWFYLEDGQNPRDGRLLTNPALEDAILERAQLLLEEGS